MPTVEFKLITGADPEKFEKRVNEALAEEWELYGPCSVIARAKAPPATDYPFFSQAMTRRVHSSPPAAVAPIGIGMPDRE